MGTGDMPEGNEIPLPHRYLSKYQVLPIFVDTKRLAHEIRQEKRTGSIGAKAGSPGQQRIASSFGPAGACL